MQQPNTIIPAAPGYSVALVWTNRTVKEFSVTWVPVIAFEIDAVSLSAEPVVPDRRLSNFCKLGALRTPDGTQIYEGRIYAHKDEWLGRFKVDGLKDVSKPAAFTPSTFRPAAEKAVRRLPAATPENRPIR